MLVTKFVKFFTTLPASFELVQDEKIAHKIHYPASYFILFRKRLKLDHIDQSTFFCGKGFLGCVPQKFFVFELLFLIVCSVLSDKHFL